MSQDRASQAATDATQSEQAALGMIFYDIATGADAFADLVATMAEQLAADDFQHADAADMVRVLFDCADRGVVPDEAILVAAARKRMPEYDPLHPYTGYHALLTQASDPSTARMAEYCHSIREAADRRRLYTWGHDAIVFSGDRSTTTETAADQLARDMAAFGQRGQMHKRSGVEVNAAMMADIAEWNEAPWTAGQETGLVAPGVLRGTTTGLRCLDRLTLGLRPGHLWLLGGRTSMGKTVFALSMARAAAYDTRDKQVGFISLEMTEDELRMRLLAAESGYSYEDIEYGRVPAALLEDARAMLDLMPISILDASDAYSPVNGYRGAITPEGIRRVALGWQREKPLSILFVDFISQVTPPQGTERDARDEKIGAVARALRALAIELKCPVVALTQLNRESERGGFHMPTLGNISDGDTVAQAANGVLFIVRPGYYIERGMDVPDDLRAMPLGYTILQIAKNRGGRTGKQHVIFLPKQMRFVDFDPVRLVASDYHNNPIILGQERTTA